MSNNDEKDQTAQDAVLPEPENFDLSEWIGGVRRTTRSVTIYQRGDLIAEIDDKERALQIAQQVEDQGGDEKAISEGYELSAIVAELNDLYEQFAESGVTFHIEARSPDWLANVEREVKKRQVHGLSKDARAALVTRTQLAGAIVQPKGITPEALATLEEVSNAQYRALVGTFFRACGDAPGVSVPFSRVSSGSRGGRR